MGRAWTFHLQCKDKCSSNNIRTFIGLKLRLNQWEVKAFKAMLGPSMFTQLISIPVWVPHTKTTTWSYPLRQPITYHSSNFTKVAQVITPQEHLNRHHLTETCNSQEDLPVEVETKWHRQICHFSLMRLTSCLNRVSKWLAFKGTLTQLLSFRAIKETVGDKAQQRDMLGISTDSSSPEKTVRSVWARITGTRPFEQIQI